MIPRSNESTLQVLENITNADWTLALHAFPLYALKGAELAIFIEKVYDSWGNKSARMLGVPCRDELGVPRAYEAEDILRSPRLHRKERSGEVLVLEVSMRAYMSFVIEKNASPVKGNIPICAKRMVREKTVADQRVHHKRKNVICFREDMHNIVGLRVVLVGLEGHL